MHKTTKIATCCYCGTRAALRLGADRHELVCAACGAPLRHLRDIPSTSTDRVSPVAGPRHETRWVDRRAAKPKRKKKRKKPLFKKLFDEVWDEVEDIFD